VAGQQFIRAAAGTSAAPGRWACYGQWLSAGVVLGVLACSPIIAQRLLHNGLLAPAFAVLIYCLARDAGIMGRVLGSRLLVLLGEASFALYILQVPIHALARAAVRYITGADVVSASAVETSPAFIVCYSALLLVIAVGALKLVEQPARRWLRKWSAAQAKARGVFEAISLPECGSEQLDGTRISLATHPITD
jgi:peptidoglycan/LPS O-acetylase OafA/YrhL